MNDEALRKQLIAALTVGNAHQTFADAVKGFPARHYNTTPANLPYSFWGLLEHVRICQWDILEYIENPDYRYLRFPDDYWPGPGAKADEGSWRATIAGIQADLDALAQIVADPGRDLFAQIPHGQPGHNILREVLIIAKHNSYHIGEFGSLRGIMDLW